MPAFHINGRSSARFLTAAKPKLEKCVLCKVTVLYCAVQCAVTLSYCGDKSGRHCWSFLDLNITLNTHVCPSLHFFFLESFTLSPARQSTDLVSFCGNLEKNQKPKKTMLSSYHTTYFYFVSLNQRSLQRLTVSH